MASVMEITQLCRLCLVKDEVNIPIFEDHGDIRQIFLKISACLPVKVSREDNLPKKICDGCSYKLELLYQFWNTSANSEKQLLKWLSQVGIEKVPASDKKAVAPVKVQPHSINSDNVVLKQEVVDLGEAHGADELDADDLNVSNDAQDYILQQQQLPYQPVTFEFQQDGFTEGEATTSTAGPSATVTSETAGVAPKRKRRAAAMKALPPHIDSEEEDDVDLVETKIAKTEEQSDDSAGEDPEPTTFVGLPSTSTDNEQPGPSGVGKGAAEAPTITITELEDEASDALNFDIRYVCECAICAKKFVHMDYLKKHLVMHSDEKPYLCDLCPKTFKRKHELTLHKNCHDKEKRFECDICSRKLKTKMQLQLHKNRHLKKYTVFCSICKEGFYKLQELKRHVLKKHENVVYTCEICGKPLRDENYLKRHMEIHKDNYIANKEYKCHICNKAYHFKSTLTRHIKEHTGGKTLFVCYICGKALASSKSLEEHLIVHQGLKPMECEVCGKCFAKRNSLRVHMRCHTGVKPYRCELCGKSFTQRPPLIIHMRYHTGERPYACDICNNAFVSRNLLNVHKKGKHQIMS